MVDKERGSHLPDVDSREPCSYQTHISLPTSFHSSSSIARTHASSRATTPATCRHHATTPPLHHYRRKTKGKNQATTDEHKTRKRRLYTRAPSTILNFIHKNRYSIAPICLPFHASLVSLGLCTLHVTLQFNPYNCFTLDFIIK